MATNHGVGGSNPSSPTAFQRGKDLYFLPEGRKIMIGIADVKLLNLGMLFPFVEVVDAKINTLKSEGKCSPSSGKSTKRASQFDL